VTTPPPPEDGWPEPDAPTVAQARETVVAPPTPPPDRRIGAGMLLALGAIALVALGFLITYLLTHRHHHHGQPTTVVVTTHGTTATAALVVVPDVRGVQAPHAEAVLRSVGLRSRLTYVAAAGKQAGSVVDVSPSAGAHVARHSEVLLTVARGATTTPATTTAPTTTAPTTTAPTTTAPTTTAPTTTTHVAPQPSTATVPDLSGLDTAGAAQALGKAGLLASLVFVPSHDELGTVEGQGKQSGTSVPFHSHVQVNVSTGPGNKPMETVPNVIGKTLPDALSAINGAHLRLIYLKFPVTTKTQAGKVVQQTPLGGGHAPQNAQVIVYLGAYRAG
jgi:beta-lactam-binding protein with PASTA domain